MSYLPFEDNPDLANVTKSMDKVLLVALSDIIDESSSRAQHAECCGCSLGNGCPNYHFHYATSEETVGWLMSQGYLDMDAVAKRVYESGGSA